MHYLVKLIVQAETKQGAIDQAERDAEDLVENGYDFDWFNMDGRWGKAEAHKVGSKKGKELIEAGMKNIRDDFDTAMRHIRFMMENFTDDEIYNDEIVTKGLTLPDGVWYPSKYQFRVASGDTPCAGVYAPDGNVWGGKVNSDRDLKSLLKDGKNLWVVPVDFHS